MSKLDELMARLCPDGVEYKPIKNVYTRLRGTPITASKMKEIANDNGNVRIFAGGKTVINAFEKDIPRANITTVPAVLVQSRGIIDFIFYEEPFTFKNEMWAYTQKNKTSVKFLYYVLKNNAQYFRDTASGMGALPQISLGATEDFKIPVPNFLMLIQPVNYLFPLPCIKMRQIYNILPWVLFELRSSFLLPAEFKLVLVRLPDICAAAD